MAQTAAQKKALAAAQALIKKQQASLKKLEAEQKTMTDAQAAVDKQLTDDAYYTKTLASGKTQAQIDALRNAYDTSNLINRVDPNNVSSVDRTTGQVTTKIDPNKGKGTGSAFSGGSPLTTYTAPDGRIFTDLAEYNAYITKTKAEEKRREGQSAYDILYTEFDRYGLGSLVKEVQQYIVDGLSQAEFTIKLRQSKPYQERFAANAKRIANGFKAIDEATYLGLEDAYQSIMQNYGLPASRYEKGNLGVQKGFEELIGGNVDPVTLEERIIEGQKVTKGNKAIIDTAKQFFPTLTDGDFLNYVLDPKNGLEEIKRKVTAVEIGAGADEAGLGINLQRALELGTAGINKAQAKQGFAAIGTGLQRGSQLAAIYGEDPYTQTTAEEEVFGLAGKTKATREREKITGLEKATFSGQSGLSAGALVRDRAGAY